MRVTITTSSSVIEMEAPDGAEVLIQAASVRVRPLPPAIRITGLDDLQPLTIGQMVDQSREARYGR